MGFGHVEVLGGGGGGGGGVANLAVFIVTVKSGRREDESHRTVFPFVQLCIIQIPLDPDPPSQCTSS